eukprot:snap_masked-scaffold_5-processed-gene-17.35-mRNA-1 protein AED:1.00 eAED:1.00 QI:0/-1/0/0/-1/1/1/0/83
MNKKRIFYCLQATTCKSSDSVGGARQRNNFEPEVVSNGLFNLNLVGQYNAETRGRELRINKRLKPSEQQQRGSNFDMPTWILT